MPLTDLGEPHADEDEIRFRMSSGAEKITVRITRAALAAVERRSGVSGFDAHRPAFAAIASRKHARRQRESDGSVLLRDTEI